VVGEPHLGRDGADRLPPAAEKRRGLVQPHGAHILAHRTPKDLAKGPREVGTVDARRLGQLGKRCRTAGLIIDLLAHPGDPGLTARKPVTAPSAPARCDAEKFVDERVEGDGRRTVWLAQFPEEEFPQRRDPRIHMDRRDREDAGQIGRDRVSANLDEHRARPRSANGVGVRRLGRLDEEGRARRLNHATIEPLVVDAIEQESNHRFRVAVPHKPKAGPVLHERDGERPRLLRAELASRDDGNEGRRAIHQLDSTKVPLLFKTRRGPGNSFRRMLTLGLPRKGHRLHIALVFLAVAFGTGCRGSSAVTTPATQTSTASAIAGTYQTAVTLTSNSCTGIVVQNNPTTVAHTSGATTFTLTHAGLAYNGTLGPSNSFSTAPKPIEAGSVTHTLTIVGSFGTNAFTADVTANVTGTGNGEPCQYVVRWVGSK
jgi:hypothetical protein